MNEELAPGKQELLDVFEQKYGSKDEMGWGPKLRIEHNYFSPDEYYEALVKRLVKKNCSWIDIGCGRNVFPSNEALARQLAAKADCLVGVDPDSTVQDNSIVTELFQCSLEDFQTDCKFDLATLRMVAEHIERPASTVGKLAQILKPGGRVVIYTPMKWAPVSVAARLVPHNLHHPIKRWLWNTETRDTFPVQFKMNTRRTLQDQFERNGMTERLFMRLDDCRIFSRSKWSSRLELQVRAALNFAHIPYPEACLLAVYKKIDTAKSSTVAPIS